MRLLLDTHAWLWFVLGDASLSAPARAAIEAAENEKLVSPASFWEVAIKVSLGKYVLPQSYESFIQQAIHGQGLHTGDRARGPRRTGLPAVTCAGKRKTNPLVSRRRPSTRPPA